MLYIYVVYCITVYLILCDSYLLLLLQHYCPVIFIFVEIVGQIKGMRDESTKPTYGCQVTIHSEQEKQMLKIYRKEEKRERKREKRGDEGDTWENSFNFDPKELRLQRWAPVSLSLCLSVFLFHYVNKHLYISECGLLKRERERKLDKLLSGAFAEGIFS